MKKLKICALKYKNKACRYLLSVGVHRGNIPLIKFALSLMSDYGVNKIFYNVYCVYFPKVFRARHSNQKAFYMLFYPVTVFISYKNVTAREIFNNLMCLGGERHVSKFIENTTNESDLERMLEYSIINGHHEAKILLLEKTIRSNILPNSALLYAHAYKDIQAQKILLDRHSNKTIQEIISLLPQDMSVAQQNMKNFLEQYICQKLKEEIIIGLGDIDNSSQRKRRM